MSGNLIDSRFCLSYEEARFDATHVEHSHVHDGSGKFFARAVHGLVHEGLSILG